MALFIADRPSRRGRDDLRIVWLFCSYTLPEISLSAALEEKLTMRW
jgi:hypothetical protein